MGLTNDIFSALSKARLSAEENAPGLMLLGAGVIGAYAVYDLCKKSIYDAAPVVHECEEEVNKIAKDMEEEKDPDILATKKIEMNQVTKGTARKLAIIYARPAVLVATTYILVGGSHFILREKYLGAAAAFTAVNSAFKAYRARTVERFGEDVDQELRYGIRKEYEQETYVDPESGEEKTRTVEKEVADIDPNNPYTGSMYAKWFDSSAAEWEKSPDYNFRFLLQVEQAACDRLIMNGYLFLNEVYRMIGLPETRAGQVVGWIYDPKMKDAVHPINLGIYSKVNRDFVNGYSAVCLIDPNVHGVIYEKAFKNELDLKKGA